MKTIKFFGINLGGELKKKGDEKLLEVKGETILIINQQKKLKIIFVFIQKFPLKLKKK